YLKAGNNFFLGNKFNWSEIYPPAPTFVESIRGESYKNIFIVGDYGLILHWNGKGWYRYDQFYTYANGNGDVLSRAWIKGNIVFIVGHSPLIQGIIYRGTQ
ncbi:MAG TPA: hypothetical protein VMU30_05505, partial [Bacteroidota bacterium]|nr:hypothetical protein [Bacteroidota bacterium]